MNKEQQLTKFIVKHKNGIKTIGGLTLAATAGVVANKAWMNWKGFTLVKLLKGSDAPTVVTNIETLLLDANIPYEIVYDPRYKMHYITID